MYWFGQWSMNGDWGSFSIRWGGLLLLMTQIQQLRSTTEPDQSFISHGRIFLIWEERLVFYTTWGY